MENVLKLFRNWKEHGIILRAFDRTYSVFRTRVEILNRSFLSVTSYAGGGDPASATYTPHSYSSHQAFVMGETTEHLSASASVVVGERRGIPCDQSESCFILWNEIF